MTTQHRDAIWNGMVDAERLDRCYSLLALRLRAKHVAFNIFISISLFTCAVIVLAEWSQSILLAILFMGSGGAVIVNYYAEYARKSAIAFMTSKRCRELGVSWRQLWREQDAPDASARIFELTRQLDEITDVELSIDEKLNARCAEEANEVCKAEFAN